MIHKKINETDLKKLRNKPCKDSSQEIKRDARNTKEVQITKELPYNPDEARYTHNHYDDTKITCDEFQEPTIVFTVKVNYLPGRPVYIDIENMIEFINSLAKQYKHRDVNALKDEIIDLLKHYRKTS